MPEVDSSTVGLERTGMSNDRVDVHDLPSADPLGDFEDMDLCTPAKPCIAVGVTARNSAAVYTCPGLVDIDLYTPAKQCLAKGLKSTAPSPSSLPAKRVYADMSKKMPQTDKPAAKTSRIHSLRQTQNSTLKKEKNRMEKSSIQDVQAEKKQKLEGGRLRQITSSKDQKQPPRNRASLTVPHAFQFCTEKRIASNRGTECSSVFKVGKPVSPFVSMAEKVRRFQMKTPDRFHVRPLSHDEFLSLPQEKPKLKLTRPKEPELETSQRVRPARVKSTAELEAELLAKMPKFKARPLNKKILEAPTVLALQRTTPSAPEFHEFHLRTMQRASQRPATTSTADYPKFEELRQRRKSAPGGGLTGPREPRLETAARARPPKVKSFEEREQDELAKIPKFKARPLDKKIFLSRGDLGIFRNNKPQVTTPMEFHFATDERIHNQPQIPLDLFSKLSLNSQQENQPPQQTKLEPFRLVTEERGQQKEQRLFMEIKENELREQEARIPKANPLPYTTDYPAVPQKPDPKERTKPKPFNLESVARHQEEVIRIRQEKQRIEQEEAKQRSFHAQPIACIGPVFVPERSRKPLTEVHEFAFHVDTRAVERADFDKKVVEKQNLYKRFRDEFEASRKADEERLIKSMRRMMVPHARPMPAFEKPFLPRRSSKELTRPRSPRLNVSHRRERRSSLTFRRQSMTFAIQKRLQMR